MPFICVRTEGGLIPADILEEIAASEATGQQPADFGLPRTTRLTDEIAAAWADARAYWEAFQRGLRRLPESDPATTVTREQWVLPLLRSLGYAEIAFTPRAAVVGNSTYAISHRIAPPSPPPGEGRGEGLPPSPRIGRGARGEGVAPSPSQGEGRGEGPPLHISGCRTDLDRRPPEGRPRLSPHALIQEYLNRTEHLWGLVTNGYRLRLLRDSALMTRPAYVEFDLEQMLAGEHFADFAILYRLLHRTRLPRTADDATACWLEQYHQQALEQGGRVRDHLRDGVEEALVIFGSGFLAHPASDDLRRKVRAGELDAVGYYRQLLRLVYRVLFLMVSEERGLVGPEDPRLALLYHRYYSLSRLRDLADSTPISSPSLGGIEGGRRHGDLWQGLCQTFRLYEERDLAQRFGMEPLDGYLFGPHAMRDLEGAGLFNADLLRAVRHLSLYREERALRRVNYAALDVEELGSVYESLLEYHPLVEEQDGRLTFTFVLGSERKTTGSYYTRPELVQELIKSALEPVLAERLEAATRRRGGKETRRQGDKESTRRGTRTTEHETRTTPLEEAILSIKVCDPACGSGHFLLAAARRLGRELARVRTGEEHPTPGEFRRAVRDVIRHCIYGVDKNPLAVDLCKVALWLEGHNRGLPLTFLDHRIKCGDSLVGVLDLNVLLGGIPDKAYAPVSGDDKKVAAGLRKRNQQEREGQLGLFEQVAPPDLGDLAGLARRLSAEPDGDVDDIRRKQAAYEQARAPDTDWWTLWTACNLWTAASFTPLSPSERGDGGEGQIPTTVAVRRYLKNPRAAYGQMVGAANALGVEHPFFHWPLEFPDVFSPRPGSGEGAGVRVGFDVVLCNPPWERIKLQEQEFFAALDPEIARAPNKAARERLIAALPQTNPALWEAYQRAKHNAEALSKFLRASECYPLTARGDINTYSVFAELFTHLVNPDGRVGMIVPTGVATDDTNKRFFAHLANTQRLLQLIGFENEAFIFPAVHHAFKFCALTVGGEQVTCAEPDYVFFCRYFHQVRQPERRFTLTREDIARINPNTRTCSISRTRQDADLTRKIYAHVPVLVNEETGENSWGVRFLAMFHMANDSGLFRTREQLAAQGFALEGNRFVKGEEVWLPLYEAKMIWHYDHRFGSYAERIDRGFTNLDPVDETQHRDAGWLPRPFYWVLAADVENALRNQAAGGGQWLLTFRDVTNATNERTSIFTVLPTAGVGHTAPLAFLQTKSSLAAAFIANANSLAFDYVARQKIGGMHMTYGFLRQLPVLPPTAYTLADLAFIVLRVLELTYTAWDLAPFAQDILVEVGTETWNRWFPHNPVSLSPPLPLSPSPFKWDEERRALLRAELDAYYARLYGLNEEELRYILDPTDVYGPDFPGETFRVLKEKEMRQYGEYRTRRLVLEVWGRLNH